uniref:Uncharacterized protein n=1 Tax=Panagrolaimus sp. PS1159 TaxID=55785 RepID=A0AC35GK40_9BILA
MLTSRIGLNGLNGFVRQISAFSLSAGIQKSHCLSTSQSLNFESNKRTLFLSQKKDLFEANLLKQGSSYRTFSTEVTEDSEKEKTKAVFPGAWENDQW